MPRILNYGVLRTTNDTETEEKWEPLAPSKEAQEFPLSQIYHEGLLKLQAKDYEKARELLESILKDPIIANSKVETIANDRQSSPSSQVQVITRMLWTVCYLQATDIDAKDSVLWNHLGTLSCSMGLLTISRWAFEQGLLCSPNNCMHPSFSSSSSSDSNL